MAIFKYLFSVSIIFGFTTGYATAGVILIDDFSWPGASTHISIVGESRAAFPPGTTGGSILSLSSGSDIATDRGLFAATNSLIAGAGQLEISLAAVDFAEIDWDVEGYNFQANLMPNVMMNELTNLGTESVDLTLELFQTSDGVNGNVGTGTVDIRLAAGASTDIAFLPVAVNTDFVGFRILNTSANPFTGRIGSITAVPEPSIGFSLLLLFGTMVRLRNR